MFGYRLSSPTSLFFLLFLGIATFFSLLSGAASFGLRVQERSYRQEDPSSGISALAKSAGVPEAEVLEPRRVVTAPPKISMAPGNVGAFARFSGASGRYIGAVVILPPTRAPPSGIFARA